MRRLRDHALTLAELLTEHSPGYTPAAARRPVLTQVHWHQHAVLGWDADEKLLAAAGAQAEHLETGCCGLAGNFGFQVSHGEVSEAYAERALLPQVREAAPGAVVLADGFSCLTQKAAALAVRGGPRRASGYGPARCPGLRSRRVAGCRESGDGLPSGMRRDVAV